jgi:guanylate kinase
MTTAIILYGPPASGKDTITRELTSLDGRYAHFRRLKVGPGRTQGYRAITTEELSTRDDAGDILYSNARYGSTYAVDRSELTAMSGRGQVPIVHLGQITGIHAVIAGCALDWLVVCLWCSRTEVAKRLTGRQDDRTAERLAAWDATAADVRAAGTAVFGLAINTELITAFVAAHVIDSCVGLS